MSPNSSFIRIPALAASACFALTAFAVADSAASASPVLRAGRTCDYTKNQYPSTTSSWEDLRATNVTCAYALKFRAPYWKCRTHGGKSIKGECKKVLGFSCHEGKRHYGEELNGKPTSYVVRVTCRRGHSQRIDLAYMQSLNGVT